MGIEVRPDGTIIAPDEATALRLSKKLRDDAAKLAVASPVVARATSSRRAAKQHRRDASRPGARDRARALLAAVGKAGKAGIQSEALSRELGLSTPKGLAAYTLLAMRLLKEAAPGRAANAFRREKDATGATTYYADAEVLRDIGVL